MNRSSGTTRSDTCIAASRCRRRNGEVRTTAMPSCAADSSCESSTSVARARSSVCSASSTSPVRRAPTMARTVRAASCSTFAAIIRGRSMGEVGATVANSRATAQPTSASCQREMPASTPGSTVSTAAACTADCVTISVLAPSQVVIDIAMATTRTICHTPVPKKWTNTSPTNTPIVTPTATSTTRPRR